MLKTKLTSTEHAALSDILKKEYVLGFDGLYTLDLGPNTFITDKDPAGLLSALEKEREELRKVKAIADKFEADKKAAEIAAMTSVEDLKKHFQLELEKRDAQAKKEKEEQLAEINKQRINNAARLAKEKALTLSNELFGDKAALMLPHVQNMLKGNVLSSGEIAVEIVDPMTGSPVLDQNFDNLKKTISTNPLYKPMVVASKASGGSANESRGNSLATTKQDGSQKAYKDYTSGELVRLKREQPELFQSLLTSQKG